MQISHPNSAPDLYEQAGDIRTGKGAGNVPLTAKDRVAHELLVGIENAPDNYRLGYSESNELDGDTWATPRHHHNFEQIRHPLKGDYSIAKDKMLPAGWVCYFPESVYYGPQRLSPNLKSLVLQFGGPSGHGFYSTGQLRKAFDSMIARGGQFEDGRYTWIDSEGERRNQDGFEAAWEVMYDQKIAYPPPRFDGLVFMNPENFVWRKDPDNSHLARKHLGTFTEREIRVEFIQVDRGSSLSFGAERSAEVLFIKQGELSSNGEAYGVHYAFGTAADEQPRELTAIEDAELFYVKLPTF